jgi:hypothetical protein
VSSPPAIWERRCRTSAPPTRVGAVHVLTLSCKVPDLVIHNRVRYESASYFALRRVPAAAAHAWWSAARRRPDAPPAVSALMAGRERVELSRAEAVDALTWAEAVGGWPDTRPSPLTVSPRDPRADDTPA